MLTQHYRIVTITRKVVMTPTVGAHVYSRRALYFGSTGKILYNRPKHTSLTKQIGTFSLGLIDVPVMNAVVANVARHVTTIIVLCLKVKSSIYAELKVKLQQYK